MLLLEEFCFYVEECRYYLILAKDLEYYDVQETSYLLNEVSKLLDAYSKGVQFHSDFWLLTPDSLGCGQSPPYTISLYYLITL